MNIQELLAALNKAIFDGLLDKVVEIFENKAQPLQLAAKEAQNHTRAEGASAYSINSIN